MGDEWFMQCVSEGGVWHFWHTEREALRLYSMGRRELRIPIERLRWKYRDTDQTQPARTDDEGRLLPPREVSVWDRVVSGALKPSSHTLVPDEGGRIVAEGGEGYTDAREVLRRIRADIDKNASRVERVLLSPKCECTLVCDGWRGLDGDRLTIFGYPYEVRPGLSQSYVIVMRPEHDIDPNGNALRDIDKGDVVVMELSGRMPNARDLMDYAAGKPERAADHAHIRAQLVDGLRGEWGCSPWGDCDWQMRFSEGFAAVVRLTPEFQSADGCIVSACEGDRFQELPHTHVETGVKAGDDYIMRCAQLLKPKVEAVRAMVRELRSDD